MFSEIFLEESISLNEYQIKFNIEEVIKKQKIKNIKNKIKSFDNIINSNNLNEFNNYTEKAMLYFNIFDNFKIIKMTKKMFQKEFMLLDSYAGDECSYNREIIALCAIMDKENYFKIDVEKSEYLYDNKEILNKIKDEFSLKFHYDTKEQNYYSSCYKSLINPVVYSEGPLLLLTLYHYYENGEPGYSCYQYKLVLHVVN